MLGIKPASAMAGPRLIFYSVQLAFRILFCNPIVMTMMAVLKNMAVTRLYVEVPNQYRGHLCSFDHVVHIEVCM